MKFTVLSVEAAVFVVLLLLNEDVNAFLTSTKDDANLRPHVVVSGLFLSAEAKYTLYVDGAVACVVDCFMEAMALHYAIFFVMDIAYPQEISNYLGFIQSVVMGQNDNSPKRRKILYLLKKISEVE